MVVARFTVGRPFARGAVQCSFHELPEHAPTGLLGCPEGWEDSFQTLVQQDYSQAARVLQRLQSDLWLVGLFLGAPKSMVSSRSLGGQDCYGMTVEWGWIWVMGLQLGLRVSRPVTRNIEVACPITLIKRGW